MNRLRLWILGAVLGSFAAGMNIGIALPKVLASDAGGISPDRAYVRDMAERFGLDQRQERSWQLVMQWLHDEEQAIRASAEFSQLPPGIQSRLLQARGTAEQRIRALLTETQRARYDAASRGETK